MSYLILKTIKGAMLQDTIAGKIYTPRSPHLTEMNSFVESFLNTSTVGSQGGPSVKRPKQLLVLVSSDECSALNDGVSDADLKDAWLQYCDEVRKEGTAKSPGDKKAGQKAVDALTDEQWATFCKDWVKKNSGAKKKAPKAAEGEEGETGAETSGEGTEGGEPNRGNRGNRNRG